MKIQIDRTTFEDTDDKIHETERGIECCDKAIHVIDHVDSGDFYGYTYKCECGNVIKSVTERRVWRQAVK